MATNPPKNKVQQPSSNLPQTGALSKKEELPSKKDEHAQLGQTAQPGMTTTAPLFTGNPFSFKGINKPAGLTLQPQLGGPILNPAEASLKGSEAPSGLSMMGSLPAVNFKKLNFEESKEM